MFGINARMNPLELRTRLLVAESEIHRAQLSREWGTLTAGVRRVTDRARTFGSIAASAIAVVAGLAACVRARKLQPDSKRSWFRILIQGASLISTVWLTSRRQGPEPQVRQE